MYWKPCTFGYFINNQLVSTAGYTIFGPGLAMLGRLRSDIRYRGHGYSKQLTKYVLDQAFQTKELKWLGANTQADNIPAQKVLNHIHLEKQTAFYGCTAKRLDVLMDKEPGWQEVTQKELKNKLLNTYHIAKKTFFPLECYYPFPSLPELFQNDQIKSWRFFSRGRTSPFNYKKKDIKKKRFIFTQYIHIRIYLIDEAYGKLLLRHKKIYKTNALMKKSIYGLIFRLPL